MELLNGDVESSRVSEIKFKFNSGFPELEDDLPASVVGSVLRAFLLDLPESIFTAALHDQFGALAGSCRPNHHHHSFDVFCF